MNFSHRLKRAFIPRSVALVGASDRVGSRGTLIWNGVMNSHRILQAYPVNPKYKYIGLTPCWSELSELPEKVDSQSLGCFAPMRRVRDSKRSDYAGRRDLDSRPTVAQKDCGFLFCARH